MPKLKFNVTCKEQNINITQNRSSMAWSKQEI